MVKCHFGLLVSALRSSSIQNFVPHCILESRLFRSSLRLLISTGPLNKARLNWGKSLEESSEFVEYCWPPLSCNPAPAPCREPAQPVEQKNIVAKLTDKTVGATDIYQSRLLQNQNNSGKLNTFKT